MRVYTHRETYPDPLKLSQSKLHCGKYRGNTFKWLMENALGYCGYFVADLDTEQPSQSLLSCNKYSFKRYVEAFKEGLAAVSDKQKAMQQKKKDKTPAATVPRPRAVRDKSPAASLPASAKLQQTLKLE